MTAKELIRELAACDDLEKEVVILTRRGYEPVDSVDQTWLDEGYGHRVTLNTNDMLYDGNDIKKARDEGYSEGCTEGKR